MKPITYSILGRLRSLILPSILLLVLCGATVASASQIYIAQTSQGSDTGADAADAHSLAWVNTAANWAGFGGGTNINGGDTIHLVGTFTNALFVGGTDSNKGGNWTGPVITILFEPNAKFSAPNWPMVGGFSGYGGAITLNNWNYITVDGGVNGLIEATDEGTGMGNVGSCGVGGAACSFFTVKNLTIRGMYVRTNNADESGYGRGIQDICNEYPGWIHNFTVTNCTISDAFVGITSDYGIGCSNYYFMGNTITRCNWGGNTSDRNSSSTLTNLVVAYNTINTFTNWNETTGSSQQNQYHHNAFYGWATSGQLSFVRVYGNRIGPDFGNQYCTAGIYFSENNSNVLIYNNIFLCNPGDAPANALIGMGSYNANNIQVYNNTFMGGGAGVAIGIGDEGFRTPGIFHIKYNICINMTFFMNNYSMAGDVWDVDYNYGYNLPVGAEYSYSTTGSSSYQNFAQWQKNGFDAHGSDSLNPLLNADGTLQASSPSAMAGMGASAALNGSGVASPPPVIAPPKNLNVQVP